MHDTIIDTIRRNRISTTEVADALEKTGVLPRQVPVTPDLHRVGTARAIFAANGSNHDMHEQVREVERGEIPIVFTHKCEDRAIFGDIVAKFVTLYRGAEAIVVRGLVRDAPRLRRERFPVWCEGFTPLGAVNERRDPFPPEEAERIRAEVDNGVVVCDDAGVVIIPAAKVGPDMVARLEYIEAQEDVWYFCLDTLKWDTKRIVCDKAYLAPDNADRIPRELREKLMASWPNPSTDA